MNPARATDWVYYSPQSSPQYITPRAAQMFVDKVKEATNGELDIKFRLFGSLSIQAADVTQAVSDNVIQMGDDQIFSGNIPLAGIVKLPWIRFMIADGIYAVPGVSLLFYLGFVFTEQMVSLIENEFSHFKNFLLIIIVLAVAGYFVYRFLRKPHVTGAPEEMPKLAEEVVHTLDSVKSVILHPHAKKKEPPPPQDLHVPPACPPGNGQLAPGEPAPWNL